METTVTSNAANENLPPIGFGTVLDGLRPRASRTYSDTYVGLIQDRQGNVCQAIVKDLPMGDLIRELMGTAIASRSRVSVPKGYLAVVDEAQLGSPKGPRIGADRRIVFASQVVRGEQILVLLNQPLPERVYNALISWGDLPALFAFDTWVANVDRHPGNLMMRSATELYAIDHGHCFDSPRTNASTLDAAANYRNRLTEWLVPHMSPDAKLTFLGAIANLSPQMLHLNIAEVLDESLAFRIDPALSKSRIEKFLEQRRANLPKLNHVAFGR